MARAVRVTLAGAALGVAIAFALGRSLEAMLYAVAPRDPATFAAVTALVAAVALAGSFVPARRAMRVDPLAALRHE